MILKFYFNNDTSFKILQNILQKDLMIILFKSSNLELYTY